MASPCLRNFQAADLPALASLINAAEAVDQQGQGTTPERLKARLYRGGSHPEQDLILAEVDGAVAGYAYLVANPLWASLEARVHPYYRGKGLGPRLLQAALARSRVLGVAKLRWLLAEEKVSARKLAAEAGFSLERIFWRLEGKGRAENARPPEGFLLRRLSFREEEALARLQNFSLAEGWNFTPVTPEEIAYWLEEPSFCPEDVVVLEREGELAGYCWTRLDLGLPGGPLGQILSLALRPDLRGRGLGRLLLGWGLDYLNGFGARRVPATLDAQNRRGLEVYESLGFLKKGLTLGYERAL